MARQSTPFDDEITLVNALRQGNEYAWKYIYKAYWPSAKKLTFGGSEGDTKEIYQASLVRLHEKLNDPTFVLEDKVGNEVKVSTYLLSIVKYKWLTEARKRGKHVSYEPDQRYGNEDDIDTDPLAGLPPVSSGLSRPSVTDEGNSSYSNDDPDEFDDEVLLYIQNMGDPCADLLLGHYMKAIPYEEMATEKGEKPGTIRKRASDCREKVKKYFLGKQY